MFVHYKIYFCGFAILFAFCNESFAAQEVLDPLREASTNKGGDNLKNLTAWNAANTDDIFAQHFKNSRSSLPSTETCTKSLPTTCAEAVYAGSPDGIYQLHLPDTGLKPFYVYCMKDPDNKGSAWTLIQRRQDGSIDFYRNWQEYKYGFGNVNGEFFLGLEHIHALTNSQLNELWIHMEDFEKATRFARYNSFVIGDEASKYALSVLGSFNGNGGDSLMYHQGQKFSTIDRDQNGNNCSKRFLGAWWYANCHAANLNGQYLGGAYPNEKFGQGIDWNTWRGHYYSLKYVHMAIRPVRR